MVKESISKVSSSTALTAAQLRAARALLGWSQEDLVERSGVSKPTIARLELGTGAIGGYASTQIKIQSALESAGVIFVAENGEGPGVRLRKRPESAADLTHKIDALEGDLAKSKRPSSKTPEGGMQKLDRAHKRNTVTKLKNRRANLGKT